jgi:hypothetical protein
MSSYVELEVLTPDCKPPTDLYCGEDITYIEQKMNSRLMFNVTINELSLGDVIGTLRAAEEKLPCRILIKRGAYQGFLIQDKWLAELQSLPYIRPWQDLAIHLGRLSFASVLIDYAIKDEE